MREKMITRTVTATVATVLGIDVATSTAVQEVKTLTGSFKDNADILKAIKKQFDGQVVYAAVVNVEEKETLYGMTESEFMKYAKELPPRKVYDQQ